MILYITLTGVPPFNQSTVERKFAYIKKADFSFPVLSKFAPPTKFYHVFPWGGGAKFQGKFSAGANLESISGGANFEVQPVDRRAQVRVHQKGRLLLPGPLQGYLVHKKEHLPRILQ